MALTFFWILAVLGSVSFSLLTEAGPAVTGALLEGAAQGITLSIALAGPLCLWAGLGALMEKVGLTAKLSTVLSLLLGRLFPSSRSDPELAGALSANVSANLLGLGNAATPMGIRAAARLKDPGQPTVATHELCRLVIMNTASIQLLPTTVAAVRQSAGAANPFDILPCVWVSSILSVSAGLFAAWCFGRADRG